MKISEVKVGKSIISPLDNAWKVIKKYSSDMWLIKRYKNICCITAGQLRRGWRGKR